jgi:D-alanyl-lipoteichoic acid acyltransferase DltB (MBOAT superfamily)
MRWTQRKRAPLSPGQRSTPCHDQMLNSLATMNVANNNNNNNAHSAHSKPQNLFSLLTQPSVIFSIGFTIFTHCYTFYIFFPQLAQLLAGHQLRGLGPINSSFFCSLFHCNRQQDLSDGQLRHFLDYFRILLPLAVGFILLSQAIQLSLYKSQYYLLCRRLYYLLFSIIFLFVLCGSKALFPIILITLNYLMAKVLAPFNSSLFLLFTWFFNCAVLLSNEYYSGYSYSNLLGSNYSWLDNNYRGLTSWQSSYNLVILKIISFNYDYYWAASNRVYSDKQGNVIHYSQHAASCNECKAEKSVTCYNWREKDHHPITHYNYFNYFIYLFYIPLYFAGPTITFNAFLSYVKQPNQRITHIPYTKYLIVYTLRWLLVYFLLQVSLHYFYVYSLFNSGAYVDLTLAAQCASVYYILVTLWLKFVYVWRFFRLWALFDCIEPVENMERCVANNYSVQQFWKSWHRSFNKWLVRYIYIPLGGNTRNIAQTILNIIIVFTFVAFWHDRTLNLLTW